MSRAQKIISLITLVVIGLAGAYLRFSELSERPMHADEATGARLTSFRLNSDQPYQFNPEHFHGPLLTLTAAISCKLAGENEWSEMSKFPLRASCAIFGSALLFLPLLLYSRFGFSVAILSASLLATSPLLVYFSRMFTHEIQLTFFGLLCVILLIQLTPQRKLSYYMLIGLTLGFMFAAKETFAISVIAWFASWVLLKLPEIRSCKFGQLEQKIRPYRAPLASCVGAFLVVWLVIYSNGFSQPAGLWDSLKTYFVYQIEDGHDKAFGYYFDMLVIPEKRAIWWHELPIFLLALVGFARSFTAIAHARVIRFLGYSAFIHLLIYSLIDYKTPWLMCLPWAHFCLLAGFSISGFSQWSRTLKLISITIIAVALSIQLRTSQQASKRFHSDERNPYAYTASNRNMESLEVWLGTLNNELPAGSLSPMQVIGENYWPLPWYLRHQPMVTYTQQPTSLPDSSVPVLFVMPVHFELYSEMLSHSHVPFVRSLRNQQPMMMYLRRDLWDKWMEN